MTGLFEIALDRPLKGSRRSAESVYTQLRAAILEGRLVPGAKLPVERESALFFGVSRNTAARVYARLAIEGLVRARRGSGTYIESVRKNPRRKPARTGRTPDPRLNLSWQRPEVIQAIGFWQDRHRAAPSRTSRFIDFRPALVDPKLFPFEEFRRVSAQQQRQMELRPPAFKSPQGNQGHFPLRTAITAHIGVSRALVCEPDDILITAGAQQAFDILARVLVTPGHTAVAIEDPGYPPMRAAFLAAGAKLMPVPVDQEGLVVDAIPLPVQIICVCPSHQFPLGVSMSARRRKALLDFARCHAAVIIEDDYDGEFRFDGSPLQALRAPGSENDVFYVGTFSKCMLPALRLGFIVAPQWAIPTITRAKNCLDWHCPTLTQMAVARYISEGHLVRHVRKLREIYRKRRDLVRELLEAQLKGELVPLSSHYGMHLAARSGQTRSLERLTLKALASDVHLHSFERYFLGPRTSNGLIFGYGASELDDIERGMKIIGRLFT